MIGWIVLGTFDTCLDHDDGDIRDREAIDQASVNTTGIEQVHQRAGKTGVLVLWPYTPVHPLPACEMEECA